MVQGEWKAVGRASRPCVFFDRDGVLIEAVVRNGKPYPPADFASMRIVSTARARRGTQRREIVEQMHRTLRDALALDAVFVCYHDDEDRCTCRKPAAGLLHQAADQFDIDLSGSFVVGDRWRDIDAGRNAGCRTILIDCSYAEKRAANADATVGTLSEAVNWILRAPRISSELSE
jgi:D-glycero-D-manno-heptose 1,7-bisphosphate phosphatase